MNERVFDLSRLAKTRSDQASYHLASEKYLRVEVFNLAGADFLGEWEYAGDMLVLVVEGDATLTLNGKDEQMSQLCAAVIPANHRFKIATRGSKSVVVIAWSPAFAELKK
jgi:quercetin dioxygenase-like cupin family protein